MYKRLCPNCKEEINYKTKYNIEKAEANNSLCRRCINKKVWTSELRKKISKKYSGEGNPFFNKHHTDESKEKYRISRKKSYKNSKYKTKEFRKKLSESVSGEKNGMYGKSVYDVWVEKYGKEKADKLEKERSKKISKSMSGKNNPMYGKPSPQGSGNGWSGWYKGWFFRSLKELSYMINVIERFNLKWESCEKGKFAIEYVDVNDKKRNYFPDFLIENKYIVEIKPKKLWNSFNIKLKQKAAEKWCNKNGYVYKIRDIELNEDKILELYKKGDIKFMKKYNDKIIGYFKEKLL
jgi:Zn-finger nucleic acid-binding protein